VEKNYYFWVISFGSMRFALFILLFTSFNRIYGQKPNIELIDDAVVLVKIYDYNNKYLGHGSGFLIDSKGTVVTNYHVIQNAYSIKITTELNGIKTTYSILEISKADKQKDIAILKINNTTNKKFSYLKIAKAPPKKGDNCWAIGTPADPEYMNTVSEGLISNIRFNENPKTIQTNAEITHGSSGGALINSAGEVVGITSSGLNSTDGARASINFAIWIKEIDNLKNLNKKRIPDEESIPGRVCFYSPEIIHDQPKIWIDGVFIGRLFKSFSSEPACGALGTLTPYLSPGKHNYYIFYPKSGSHINSTLYVTSGSCWHFKVHQPKYQTQKNIRRTSTTKKIHSNPKSNIHVNRIYNWSVFANISGSAPYSEYSYDGFPIFSYGIEKFIMEDLSIALQYKHVQPYTSEYPSNWQNIIREETEYEYKAYLLECRLWKYLSKEEWLYLAVGYDDVIAKIKNTKIHENSAQQDPPFQYTDYGSGINIKIAYNRLIMSRLLLSADCIYSKYNSSILDRARYKNWDIDYDAAGLNFNVGLAFILDK
jgi:hypothetical protein